MTTKLSDKSLAELLESLSDLERKALAALGRVNTQEELATWCKRYIAGPKREKDHDDNS